MDGPLTDWQSIGESIGMFQNQCPWCLLSGIAVKSQTSLVTSELKAYLL